MLVCEKWASSPLFVWSRELGHELFELLRPSVEVLGYELVGVELLGRGGRATLRVYIDAEDGVTLEDCEQVSHQVSGLLDVEDPIPGRYVLEVSSPGLDRPLFRPEDYRRFQGSEVRIRAREPVHGRRNFRGRLVELRGEEVVLLEDGETRVIPLGLIGRANLVPDL